MFQNSNIEINGLRQNCERTESGQFADFAQCPGAFQIYKKPRNYYFMFNIKFYFQMIWLIGIFASYQLLAKVIILIKYNLATIYFYFTFKKFKGI